MRESGHGQHHLSRRSGLPGIIRRRLQREGPADDLNVETFPTWIHLLPPRSNLQCPPCAWRNLQCLWRLWPSCPHLVYPCLHCARHLRSPSLSFTKKPISLRARSLDSFCVSDINERTVPVAEGEEGGPAAGGGGGGDEADVERFVFSWRVPLSAVKLASEGLKGRTRLLSLAPSWVEC